MKVSDLKKGMMLECVNDDECFVLSNVYMGNDEPPWLLVGKRRRGGHLRWTWPEDKINKFAIYLGTKKDVNVSMEYCDKFVLIGNKIAGVDPSVWRKLRSVDESW